MSRELDERLDAWVYANTFGTLTPEEEKELYETAASNPDIFAKLIEAEPLRAAMQSHELRRNILDALQTGDARRTQESPQRVAPSRAPTPAGPGTGRFSFWPFVLIGSATCTAALLLIVFYHRPATAPPETAQTNGPVNPSVAVPGERRSGDAFTRLGNPPGGVIPLKETLGPNEEANLAGVFDLQPRGDLQVQAVWPITERGQVGEYQLRRLHSGEPILVRVSSSQPGTVWAFHRGPTGLVRLLSPVAGLSLKPGESIGLEGVADKPPVAAGSSGEQTLRLVVLTNGETLFHGAIVDTRGITGPVAVVDLKFFLQSP